MANDPTDETTTTFECPHTRKREISTAGYGKKVFCQLCNQELPANAR